MTEHDGSKEREENEGYPEGDGKDEERIKTEDTDNIGGHKH